MFYAAVNAQFENITGNSRFSWQNWDALVGCKLTVARLQWQPDIPRNDKD